MSIFRNQSGVAMVTVLFVGAILTVVSSTAFVMSVQDLQAGSDDRRAAAALAYAEAGLDRFLLEFKALEWDWEEIVMSGCDAAHPVQSISGAVGGGTYEAEVHPLVCPPSVPSPRESQRVAIFSEGRHPAARRVVRQVVRLEPKGLPVGMYAKTKVAANSMGSGVRITNVSMVSEGPITGRNFLTFTGMDPFYTRSDFYPTFFAPENPGSLPSAAHTTKTISCQTNTGGGAKQGNCGTDLTEHTADDIVSARLNCTANAGDVPHRAAWDGSGSADAGSTTGLTCGAGLTKAPTSKFLDADADRVAPQPQLSEEDVAAMKQEAQISGLYCDWNANGDGNCTVKGVAQSPAIKINSTFTKQQVAAMGFTEPFIAYFDTAGSNPKGANNTVRWNAEVATCEQDRLVTMIAPNGSMSFGSGAVITGAVIAEKGAVSTSGGASIVGTVIADDISINGTSNFEINQCWLDKTSFLFLDVIPQQWSEIDR